jgi:hypothetical protein
MARRSPDLPRRLALLAVAAALAAALGAAGARLARRGEPAIREESYTCRCGAAYRVSGVDRHRVYWREGAPESQPVLGDRCVECDAPLPARHETALA